MERFRVSVGSAHRKLRKNQRDDSVRFPPSNSGPHARRSTEPRLLGENGVLETAKLFPRLHTELLNKRLPRSPVGLEGIRLAAGTVEDEHELGVVALAERRERYELLELSDKLGRPPQGNLRVDPPLLGE